MKGKNTELTGKGRFNLQNIQQFITNFRKYFRYAYREAKAELKSEVSDSYLNWIWWVLNPLAFMLIYTVVFGYIFKASEKYFIPFVLIGVTVWDFVSRMLTVSVNLIVYKRDLVTKAYIPKYILLFSKSLVYLFKFFISLSLLIIAMFIQRVPFSFRMLYFFPILLVLIVVAFGAGMILMHFGVFVQDLSNAITILLRFLFYLSGVFYNINIRIKEETIRFFLLRANPFAFVMNEFRKVMIYNQDPSFKGLLVWLLIGFLLCLLGIRLIHKNENSYAKVI